MDLGITIATGISQANDQSGNGRDVTQGTGSAQPARILNAYNGKPTARFTAASSQFLSRASTNLFGSGAYSQAVVMQTASNNQGVYSCSSLNAGCGLIDNGVFRSAGHYGVAAFDDGTASSVLEVILITRAAASKPNMYLNGAVQTLSGASTTLTDPGAGAAIIMGARNDSGAAAAFLGGDISEVISYTTDLSVSALARLNHYLGAWHGVAA
jgi:hypothetical protein